MPLTVQDLKVAASFLRQARSLCEGVRDFFLGNDNVAAARIAEIANRLDDETDHVERLILAKVPNGGSAS